MRWGSGAVAHRIFPEAAGLSAWTFGTTRGTAGAKYNMQIGGKNVLIQRNWINSGSGGCQLSG